MPVWHTDPCYKGASAVRMKAKRTASGRKRIFIFQTPPTPLKQLGIKNPEICEEEETEEKEETAFRGRAQTDGG